MSAKVVAKVVKVVADDNISKVCIFVFRPPSVVIILKYSWFTSATLADPFACKLLV